MTDILSLRSRRFHGLYALLTGDVGPQQRDEPSLPETLSTDVKVPELVGQNPAVSALRAS